MRFLVIISILGVTFAIASPTSPYDRRGLDVVIEIVTVTVSKTVAFDQASATPNVQSSQDESGVNLEPNFEPIPTPESLNPPGSVIQPIQGNPDGSNVQPLLQNDETTDTSDPQQVSESKTTPNVIDTLPIPQARITSSETDVQPAPNLEPISEPENIPDELKVQAAPDPKQDVVFEPPLTIKIDQEVNILPQNYEGQPPQELLDSAPIPKVEPAPAAEIVPESSELQPPPESLDSAPIPKVEPVPAAEIVPESPEPQPPPESLDSAPVPKVEPAPAAEIVPESSELQPPPESLDAAPIPKVEPDPVAVPTPITPVVQPTPSAETLPAIDPTIPSENSEGNVPLTDYQSSAIFHHNIHRANHTAGKLTWNSTLAKFAVKTAKKCVFAHDFTQGDGRYGQNLASFGSSLGVKSLDRSKVVAHSITDQWYNEEFDFVPFGIARPSIKGPEFLHFTQTVWKDTETVGCATVECRKGTVLSLPSVYTVCNYFPAGNILGEFDIQVSEPLGMDLLTTEIS